jgi:hypothetical protein
MTAEIAVMNPQAVALAADSAVTVTGEEGVKIFASANKIFALSKYEPVGVMIYGSASLLGMPWEAVIKEYRERLGSQRFPHVADQAAHFLKWLGTASMFNDDLKRSYVESRVSHWFDLLRETISQRVGDLIEVSEGITRRELQAVVRACVRAAQEYASSAPLRPLPRGFLRRLESTYITDVDRLISEVFEELPLTATQRKHLRRLAFAPLLRSMNRDASGVVVSGFGCDDWMPSLRTFMVDGIVLDRAIFMVDREVDIRADAAYVSGFAQADMISTFMEGVAPEYQQFLDSYLGTVIDRFAEVLADASEDTLQRRLSEARSELLEEFAEEMSRERFEAYVEPVLDVVRSLPKDELGGLAESLVSLTSLKRRISRDDETVGGPVDVAVITKGDGLIWLRRKHYFEPELNQQFFANYYRERADAH